jgi:hypothetical protein
MSRDQRAGGPILGRGTKAIGSLIGAGWEAYAHRKAKSTQEEQSKTQQVKQTHTDSHGFHDEHDEQLDEEDWALDEASIELATDEKHAHPKLLIETPGLEIPSTSLRPLPYPVILPQRRPQTKSRGFVRAYAPLLGECKGIDERTFLQFLDEFYNQTQTSDALQAVNVAANVVGMVPSVITMAISMAASTSARAAIETQGRYRTNTYLDQINIRLFNPRNLHCVIMTFQPSSSQNIIDVSLHSNSTTTTALTQNMAHASKLGKLQGSAGTSHGEPAIPAAAPLIYPSIDAAASLASQHNQPPTEPQQNALKRSSAFLKDYLDRRAAAEYAGTHGSASKLALPDSEELQFASRYSDPNHPANSGGILALLTGGAVDPRAKLLGKRAEGRARMMGKTPLTEQERRNVEMGRGVGGGRSGGPLRGAVRKVLKEDVLYLLIAEIPRGEDEMEGM